MRETVFLVALILLQYACGQPAEPPPPPPPPPTAAPVATASEPAGETTEEKTPSAEQLQSSLTLKWEGGEEGKLVIELGIKNPGASPIRLGFNNSGRVCGVVLDSETAASQGPRGSKAGTGKGYRFPQLTAQVMGEETFAPGQTRTFRFEVPRRELGASLAASYTVDAWLCGHDKLRQRASAKTSDAK